MLLVGYPEEHLASKKLSDEVLGVVICLQWGAIALLKSRLV